MKRTPKRHPWRVWRLCEVTVRCGDFESVSIVSAPSRSAARMSVFRSFSDVWTGLTFRQFVAMATVRISTAPPADDGYGFIRSYYRIDVALDEAVTITHEGADLEGRRGVVVYPDGSRQYVHVVLEGESHVSLFHPLSIVQHRTGVVA